MYFTKPLAFPGHKKLFNKYKLVEFKCILFVGLSSTVETVSENEIVIVKPENSDNQIAEDISPDFDQANALMFEDFYKPELSTPSRFAHSEDSSFSDSVSFSYESESIDLEEDDDEGTAG